MKRLNAICSILMIASACMAIGPQTNSESVTISSTSGGQFDQFYFNIGSYNDQYFSITLDQSISNTLPQFKMSYLTETGQVSRFYTTNITVNGSVATWSIARTNMTMPTMVYLAELYTVDSGDNIGISLARGKCNVTRSLFSTSGDVVTQGAITNLSDYLLIAEAANTYVRKDGDLTQMSGLGGTVGQIFQSDGDGTGSWADNSDLSGLLETQSLHTAQIGSNELNIAANADAILATSNGVTVAFQSADTVASNALVSQIETSTNALPVSLHINGDNAMTGDINGGGQSATNFLDIRMSGTLYAPGRVLSGEYDVGIGTGADDTTIKNAILTLDNNNDGTGAYYSSPTLYMTKDYYNHKYSFWNILPTNDAAAFYIDFFDPSSAFTPAFKIQRYSGTTNTLATFYDDVAIASDLTVGIVLLPSTSNTVDLGSETLPFAEGYIKSLKSVDSITIGGNATVSSNLTVNGSTFVQTPTVSSNAATKAYVDVLKTEKTIRISPDGGDYQTIQSALDAVPTANTLYLVYPGRYTNDTINFTANGQCVKNAGKPNTTIIVSDDQIVECADYASCSVDGLNLQMNPTTATNMIEVNNGDLRIIQSKYTMTCSADIAGSLQPHIIHVTGTGECVTKFGEFYYYHTGNTTTGLKTMFDPNGGSISILRPCSSAMTNAGTALASSMVIDSGSGLFNIQEACDFTIQDTDAGIVVGMGYISSGGDMEFHGCRINVIGGGANNCYGIYHAGTGKLKSGTTDYDVSGGANNYGFLVNAGATLESNFDNVNASNGNQIAGTLIMVTSLSDGSLNVSSNLAVGGELLLGGNLNGGGNNATNFLNVPILGTLNGTNGVYWTSLGTNRWLLFD